MGHSGYQKAHPFLVFYPLILHDGNRNLSKRPAQINDCSVRALAIITNTDYDTVYELLSKSGRKPCQGFDLPRWLKRRKGKVLGGVFTPVKVKGLDDRYSQRPHLTPLNFASYHPRGRFLLEHPTHVWSMIDGIHHDLWRVKQDRPLTGAWEFKS